MNSDKYFIIDFDSTFINCEALDLLAEISLKDVREGDKIIQQIRMLTHKAMEGSISFSEALEKRIKLLRANKKHIEILINKLNKKVSQSVISNKKFFKKYANNIFILSGGFKEYIAPITAKSGIPEKNVFANTFTYDNEGNITGYDKKSLLSKSNGKVLQLRKLNLKGEIIAIGDGYTDYELKKSNLVGKFYAFTENIKRESVTKTADHILPNFDEFLYISNLPMNLSYPKNRIKVLILENIHNDAYSIFKKEGYSIESIAKSLSEEELCEKIKDVSILAIRSKTQVSEKVLSKAKKLLAVGAFCVGTNHIDLIAAQRRGIIVFNAPFSNTRSVVELVIGEIIILLRNITEKSNKLHQGIWDKTSANSYEVRGKKLGIIGYGKIGSQLSILAEDLGMEVMFYDIIDKLALGNAKKCRSLNELLSKADIISIHVDGSKENNNLIDEKEFRLMKNGVILLNLSRGNVVNLNTLEKYIKTGKVAGASIDVFPNEPNSNDEMFQTPLQGLKNVILTPHIGGSTSEAQKDIANYVPNKIIDFINTGNTYYSVNFPNLQLPALKNGHRLIHIHHNVPGILAHINAVFAQHNINIMGQYLKTNEHIGYVITDISKKYNPAVISDLKKIDYTIKFRILY